MSELRSEQSPAGEAHSPQETEQAETLHVEKWEGIWIRIASG